MAASDAQITAGQRLASDLRAIRRKNGVDQKEVLDATRLADDVIEQLEENGLVNHPAFNKVYLRSLYAAYGEAIGVKRSDMVQALKEMFDGHYVGSLARTYLGVPLDSGQDSVETTEDASAEETEDGEGLPATSETPDEGEMPDSAGETKKDAAVDPDDEGAETQIDLSDSGDEDIAVAADAAGQDPPNWKDSESSESEGRKLVRPKRFDIQLGDRVWKGIPDRGTVLLPNMSGTALLAVAALAFIALIWFAISSIMDFRSSGAEDLVSGDTTNVEEIFRPDPIVLPDTFRMDIVAWAEALDPIRITVDRDLRRPYWVEHLDTLPFLVVDRIQLEREVENTRVLADGFVLPGDWLQQGQVELDRTRVQTWLDSLTSAGVVPQRDVAYR
ncbi:MAG: helix-turn-helix domain-containing protein [Bacteroidota bacterium]|nr:helix-turn-helix domain-containing protein [Bacteroidota bacterium]